MDNLETKNNVKLLDTINSIIKKEQDFSDEDMSYITNTIIKEKNNVFYVRLHSADITMDFIIQNLFTKPSLIEVEFIDFDNDFTKIS